MVSMPHWPNVHKHLPTRLDLSPMFELLEALGNPHLKIPPAIHIAGTNGKGSTVSYLRTIFQNAGLRVHSYTSPHILQFNERIELDGCPIFDGYLHELCERVRITCEKANLDSTFFEATTAVAFLAFSETPADIVILETGMGGRLDATNVIPEPLTTIITPISYDHMEALGYNLLTIAGEKACIIKKNVPSIISAQTDEVFNALFAKCDEMNSKSIAYGYDFSIEKETDGFTTYNSYGKKKYPFPNLRGDHQIVNAAGAIEAALLMRKNFSISDENIIYGITHAHWPARIQTVKKLGHEVIIDGAHNAAGAQVLSLWVKKNLKSPISIILGMTKNRDALAFTSYFKDIINHIYCVQVKSEPSSYPAEKIAEMISPHGIPTTACNNLEEAITLAAKNSKIVITGSLFLAADALKL